MNRPSPDPHPKPYNRGKYDDIPPARGTAPVPLPDGQTVRQPGWKTYDEIERERQLPDSAHITWRWVLTLVTAGAILAALLIYLGPATSGRY